MGRSQTEDDSIIFDLDPMHVEGKATDSYYATNTFSGTRFNTQLLALPKTVEVMTSEFIEDLGAVELSEVLKYSGSVADNSSGAPDDITGSSFAIRGYSTFTTYRNGYRSFGIADNMFIDRIEIIKGPSSVFSGTIEPGGTINVITRRPPRRAEGYVRLRVASEDSTRVQAVYGGPLNAARTALYRVGVAYEDYGSPYDFAGRQRLVVGGNFQYNLGKRTQLTVDGQWIDTQAQPAAVPVYVAPSRDQLDTSIPRNFNRMGPDAFSDLKQGQGNLDFNHSFNAQWSVRLGVYYRYQDLMRLTVGGSTIVNQHLATGIRSLQRIPTLESAQSYDVSPQLNVLGTFEYGGIRHRVFVGYEYLYANQDNLSLRRETGLPNINLADLPNPDLALGSRADYTRTFLDRELESTQRGYSFNNVFELLNDRLHILQGYRYGTAYYKTNNRANQQLSNEETKSADVWNFGVSMRVLPRVTAFVSYSESYLPQRDADADGELFEPIMGEGWDLGLKFDIVQGRLSGSLVAYDVLRANVPQPDPDNPGFRIQTGEDTSRGVEFTLLATPVTNWQVVVSYAHVDSVVKSDPTRPFNVGQRTGNIPQHQGSVWNRYRFSDGVLSGLGIGVGVLYVGERRGNPNLADQPGLRSPAYTRVDCSITYPLRIAGQRFTLGISINNVFDKEYLRSYSGWGDARNYAASLTFRF
jgi:iron complex outermembrane recepter protein